MITTELPAGAELSGVTARRYCKLLPITASTESTVALVAVIRSASRVALSWIGALNSTIASKLVVPSWTDGMLCHAAVSGASCVTLIW